MAALFYRGICMVYLVIERGVGILGIEGLAVLYAL
jgi:hypothetical protein